MDPLARHAALIALRIAAIPAEGLRDDPQALDLIEQLALKILEEVSAAKIARSRKVGENRGTWQAMEPLQR